MAQIFIPGRGYVDVPASAPSAGQALAAPTPAPAPATAPPSQVYIPTQGMVSTTPKPAQASGDVGVLGTQITPAEAQWLRDNGVSGTPNQAQLDSFRRNWQANGTGPANGGAVAVTGGRGQVVGGTGGAQPYQAGVNTDAGVSKRTIGGALGGSGFDIYTANPISNTLLPGQLASLNAEADNARSRPSFSMSAGQAAGTMIDPTQQAQFRGQQLALGQQLMDQANGIGPSVAGSQLQQSTEMNLNAALAQAASSRGGNLGAAQYALGNARANIQQQSAMQLAQARIQEQMAARAQLGDVLNAGRGADIGLATNQAGLSQANNQFNAAQLNQAGATNLGAAIQQRAQNDSLVQFYLSQGISLEEAQRLASIQQGQFNAGALNAGTANANGIAVQQNAQNLQLAGGIIGSAGSLLGSVAGPIGSAAGSAAGSFVANGANGPMTVKLPGQ